MNALVITKQDSDRKGVARNIRAVTDHTDPAVDTPAPGHAILRTLASAMNHMDIWVGLGIPGIDLTYPRVSGCDACAVVESVGAGADPAWVGRRVIVNAAVRQPDRQSPDDPPGSTLAPDYQLIGEHHNGMHRQRFAAPIANCAALPDDANGGGDPHQAAAFGLTTLTAYSMMVTKGQLRPGQSVLITGIGGGVATSALAIANWLGCRTIVTSRHQWKLDRATELGATDAILDDGSDWSKQVRALTNKRGVDMCVDSVGKPTHMKCIKSLARGGAFVTPGNTGGPIVETDQARIFWNQLRILGSTMGSNNEFREITALFRAGHLAPVIDKVFPWRDGAKAWERLEAAEQFGKIVIDWS